jgi:Dolichyl-phosphate-mannose-protein mannosyltransferase
VRAAARAGARLGKTNSPESDSSKLTPRHLTSSATTASPETKALPGQSRELARLSKRWQRYAAYAALILVLAFFALVRVRLRDAPLERDEGEYAYAGQLILQGIPPYKLVYSMKLPGTYYVYAAIMAIFGQTAAGIHLGLMLANAAASFLLFLIAKRLHGLLAGVLAGCTYALLSTRLSVLGLEGHATHFVVLFALAGILLLLHTIEKNSRTLLFCSGISLGLGFLMKQPGILFGIFAFFYWLWTQHERPRRELAVESALFVSGIAAPFALTCQILYRAGVFREFWFWTFSYARAYGSILNLRGGWRELRVVGPWAIRPFVIWEIAAVGLTAVIWSRKVRERSAFTVGFAIFSALAVFPGLYFRPHYFIMLLPAVALWTGIAVAAAQEELKSSPKLEWLPLAVFLIALAFSVHGHWKVYFRLDPGAVYQKEHDSQGPGCADGCAQDERVGDYIRDHSSETDQVAVLGSEPAIYFYARRHSATGYIYMFPVTEKQPFAPAMQRDMMDQLVRSQPKLLVYVDDGYSWQTDKGALREEGFIDRVQQFVRAGYTLEQSFPIASDSWHVFGDHSVLYIFRKKDGAE